jgi:amino acid transporter
MDLDFPPGAAAGVPPGSPTLRRDYLTGLENVAQTLGTMAPTGTLGVIIPLLIGKTGNGTWLLFLGVLAICLLILVNINGFASRCASAGGLATYARLGLGRSAGVWTGWIYIGAMLFGAASSAPSAAYYACLVISRATGIPNDIPLQAAVTALVVLAAWWTAFRDMKLSGDVMIVIEITSLTVMIAIIVLAMLKNGVWVDRPQLTLQGVGPRAFSAGLVLAFLTMGGFESATTLGEEARHAERAIPRAILGCVVPIGVLYLVMTYLLVGLGRKFGIALDQLDTPFDTLSRLSHFPVLGTLSSVGVALSYFACTLGSINAGSRTMYSMAEGGYFLRSFGSAHPENATPHRAIALFGLLSIAIPVGLLFARMTLYSVIDNISQLAALGFIGAYFMVCLAAPFFLAKENGLSKPRIAASVGALILLGVVMVQSVYPVPHAPACYLPYIFAATITAGAVVSWRTKGTSSSALAA